MNKKIISLILVSLFFVLVSCTEENINNDTDVENITSEIIGHSEQKASKDADDSKELSIDTRCIGCGKCAIIAPSNFSMDKATRKAVVISQKEKFSKKVSDSMRRCPTDSIHIS